MAYVIDGNNLMWCTPNMDASETAAQHKLLVRLAEFCTLHRHRPRRITVVFDGSPLKNVPHGSVFRGVQVLYSPHHSNADAVIQEMVSKQKNKSVLIVVTSDRSLSKGVRANGVRVLSCEQFSALLKEAFRPGPKQDKEENISLSSDEVDDWMRYFGLEDGENGKRGEG